MTEGEREIEQLFLDAFIADLEEYPEHYEIMYDVPIEKIKADPAYFYDLPIDGPCFDIKGTLEGKIPKEAYSKALNNARRAKNKGKRSKGTGIAQKVAVCEPVKQKTANKSVTIGSLL